jgi:single-strand DNA-binding protein
MSLNRVTLIGRMVRDPELRTTNTGKNVVEFTIAVDKRLKPTDPNQPTADFFRCKAWNQTADFVSNYGGKGRLTAVDGRLETRKYVDKDGNNREIVEIVADNVNLLDRPRDEAGGAGGGYGGANEGGGGYSAPRPAAPAARPAAPAADEYDPFADE